VERLSQWCDQPQFNQPSFLKFAADLVLFLREEVSLGSVIPCRLVHGVMSYLSVCGRRGWKGYTMD